MARVISLAATLVLLLAAATPAAAGCDLPDRWMGWHVSLYNEPSCESDLDAVRIGGGGSPAGVFLTRAFESPRNLVLRVEGADRKNQVNLRVRVDGGDPVWHDAPVGEQSFVFEAVAELELLIYADVAFDFTLIDARLLPAGPQAGPVRLNRRLIETARGYGDGVLVESGGRYSVVAPTGPGGVFFTHRGDGPAVVSVSGAPIEGRGNLRIQEGHEGPLRYFGLASGRVEAFVEGDGPVELLIYADEPFEFGIEEISATSCESCGTDADLLDLLEREIPGIAELTAEDPLAGARELLNWAAVNGDWTEEPSLERRIYPQVVGNPAGYAYFEIFAKDKGGVFCGGLAVFFNKLLHLYGYDSFVVDFGDPRGGLTHLTTVVALPDETGERRFYIFDPWLNATFRRGAGREHYPLFAIVDAQRKGGLSDLFVDARSLAERDWHFPLEPTASLWHECEVLKNRMDDFKVCKVPSFTVASFLDGVAASWEAVDVPPRIEGLFTLFQRRIFSASYPSEPASLQAFLDKARARGIPVGYPE